jgi:hypothetical protein
MRDSTSYADPGLKMRDTFLFMTFLRKTLFSLFPTLNLVPETPAWWSLLRPIRTRSNRFRANLISNMLFLRSKYAGKKKFWILKFPGHPPFKATVDHCNVKQTFGPLHLLACAHANKCETNILTTTHASKCETHDLATTDASNAETNILTTSWIIRGACMLHDPTGVRKQGRNGRSKWK